MPYAEGVTLYDGGKVLLKEPLQTRNRMLARYPDPIPAAGVTLCWLWQRTKHKPDGDMRFQQCAGRRSLADAGSRICCIP